SIFTFAEVAGLNRLLNHPEITPRFYAAFLDLIDTVFDPEVIFPLLHRVLDDVVPPSRIEQMKDFVTQRTAAVMAQIPPEFTIAANRQLTMTVRDGYLPGIPILVQAAVLDQTGHVDRDLWDAVVTLSTDRADVTLSTDTIRLYNGRGSSLVTVEGDGPFTLTATLGTSQVGRTLASLQNTPMTEVSGTLPAEQTVWSGIMHVTGDVLVPDGHTLTIQPGTLVLLDGVVSGENGTDIDVEGRIESLGTFASPVTFTAMDSDRAWGEIHHVGAEPSVYRYTNVTRAGHSPTGGHTQSGSALRLIDSAVELHRVAVADIDGKIMTASGSELIVTDSHLARAVMGPEIDTSDLRFERSWITEMFGRNDNDGIYLHPQKPGQTIVLRGGVIAYGDDDGIDTRHANVTVENYIVRDFADKGISVGGDVPGDEVHLNRILSVDNGVGISAKNWKTGHSRVFVDHATVVGNEIGIQARDKFNAPDAVVEFFVTNSIVWGNGVEINAEWGPADVHVDHSNVDQPWAGVGNIRSDPQFVASAANVYRLRATSPSIDAGDPSAPRDADGSRADQGYATGTGISGEPVPIVLSGRTLTIHGTGDDDRFEVEIGVSYRLTINGTVHYRDPARIDAIVIDAAGGNDTVVLTGSGMDETAELRPGRGTLRGGGYTVTVTNAESITIDGRLGQDEVVFIDSAGDDRFTARPGNASMIGSNLSHTAIGFETVVARATAGGFDRARLDDSAGTDKFLATPAYGALVGEGFSNRVEWFELVEAYSTNGGNDQAKLGDSVGDDRFDASPDSARLFGQTFDNRAYGFRSVYAYATEGGIDVAELHDSPGDDRFHATPEAAALYGEGFFNRAKGFARVNAHATAGGQDEAKLYDSPGNDTFLGTPSYGSLRGDGFHNRAEAFDSVRAYATAGGYDVAKLGDSSGDDRFVATPAYGTLYGDGFSNRAESFDAVYAYATQGGTDLAKLGDSAGNDRFDASPTVGALWGDGFLNRAKFFESVHAYATEGGFDTANLHGSAGDDIFHATPDAAALFGEAYFNRVKFFESVKATGGPGGNDEARLFDSPGDDTFLGTPEYGTLYGNDFHNRAEAFDRVRAYSREGGTDVAKLRDSAGDDTFVATPDHGELRGDGFSNRVESFDAVHAYATEGGIDEAHLYDSPGDDKLYSSRLADALFGDGFFTRAKHFENVYAHADAGGNDQAILDEATVENPTKTTPGTTPDVQWAKIAWLYDFENCVTKKNSVENLTQRAVDGILTALWSH
ncbi:MAG: hypothetical protein V3R99_09200, partial [Thermoguttaceae bacterium]